VAEVEIWHVTYRRGREYGTESWNVDEVSPSFLDIGEKADVTWRRRVCACGAAVS